MPTATSRPLLLGHRGVRPVRRFGAYAQTSKLPSENTLAAFDYALTNRCDGFEFDVRFTQDHRAIVCHDPQLGGREISAADYAELGRAGSDPACLEDVLLRFGTAAYLDIELKTGGNEERVIAALRGTPPSCGYVVSSFFPEILLRIKQLDSSVPLGFICDRAEYVNVWTELPIAVLIPHHKLVTEKLIAAAHRRDVQVFTWTVNQRRDLVRLSGWGVDGLISDDPALLSRTFVKS